MRPPPKKPNDAVSVAVDGRYNTPSPAGVASVFVFAFASPRAAPFVAAVSRPGDPARAAAPNVPPHGDVRFAPGLVPTIADPSRHDDPPGLVSFAPAVDGDAKADGVAPLGLLHSVAIWPVAGTPAEVPARRHAETQRD